MNMKSKIGLVSALALVALACGTEKASGPLVADGPTGRVRFVNLITDPARNPVNAILEGVPFGVNLGYGGTTPSSLPTPATANYSAVLTGDRTIVLQRTANTSVEVGRITFTIAENQDRTVYATGGTAGAAVTNFVTTDANPVPTASQVQLRFVNMATDGVAYDYFVTAPNADLSTATPVVTNLGNQAASGYVTVAPGTYQVRVVPAGTDPTLRSTNVALTYVGGSPATSSLALAGGTGRTFVTAMSSSGATPLVGFILPDK
jgi:hypothetical protein